MCPSQTAIGSPGALKRDGCRLASLEPLCCRGSTSRTACSVATYYVTGHRPAASEPYNPHPLGRRYVSPGIWRILPLAAMYMLLVMRIVWARILEHASFVWACGLEPHQDQLGEIGAISR